MYITSNSKVLFGYCPIMYIISSPYVLVDAAWIGSVQIAMMFLLAPFASVVEDMIGLRGTALFGAAIATTGTFVSSYVVTVDMLILTYGFIVGIGYSFIHTPSSVILGHYFERHLGLANGIVQAGSSLAVITLPFTLEGVVEEIGVKHTFKVGVGSHVD